MCYVCLLGAFIIGLTADSTGNKANEMRTKERGLRVSSSTEDGPSDAHVLCKKECKD